MLLSAYLRFDIIVPEKYLDMLVMQLPSFIILTLVFALLFKLYDRIWRYAGSSELLAVAGTTICSAFSWYGYSLLVGSLLPRSIYIISGVLLLLFLGSSRLALRVYNYLSSKPRFIARFSKNRCLRKVLIVGAGDAGAVIAREIERYHNDGKTVAGFIDDDEKKIGKRMFGVKVLGNRLAIKENVIRMGIEEIIVAMPSVKGEALKQILEICKRTKCQLKILPGVYELIDGTVSVSQLRNVEIEDLLGREAVRLNTAAVSAYLKDKIVLVTGAGGSIGSEICRQVAKMQPKKMLLLGKGENSIYEIMQELNANYPELKKVPIIADVRDRERIKGIMDCFEPQVVFHAAAHKHVPLMETSPNESIKNNVIGTYKTVLCCIEIRHTAFRFDQYRQSGQPNQYHGRQQAFV